MYSTAEYCAPVWCRSAHTRFIDPAINDALRIVHGCLRRTSADNFPILAGIQPVVLHRNGATLSSTPFHGAWTSDPLSAHPSIKCKCTAPVMETPILPTAQNSTVYLTITTYMRRNGRITNRTRSGRITLQDSALSSPTLAPTNP